MENLITLGKRIYDTGNPREVHRLIVFLGRAILHYGEIKRLCNHGRVISVKVTNGEVRAKLVINSSI